MACGLGILFDVDGGHVGGGLGMRGHQASLFAVTDKILDILYCAHDGRRTRKSEGRGSKDERERGKEEEFREEEREGEVRKQKRGENRMRSKFGV